MWALLSRRRRCRHPRLWLTRRGSKTRAGRVGVGIGELCASAPPGSWLSSRCKPFRFGKAHVPGAELGQELKGPTRFLGLCGVPMWLWRDPATVGKGAGAIASVCFHLLVLNQGKLYGGKTEPKKGLAK